MSKSMVLVLPVAAFESRIAWRSEPGPLSAVVLTRKLERSVRSSMTSTRGRSRKIVPAEAGQAPGASTRASRADDDESQRHRWHSHRASSKVLRKGRLPGSTHQEPARGEIFHGILEIPCAVQGQPDLGMRRTGTRVRPISSDRRRRRSGPWPGPAAGLGGI